MLTSMAHHFVDLIQNGKKTFIATAITNDKLATILEDFVDAQTAYTKSAITTGVKTATELGKLITTQDFFGSK